MVMKGIVEEHGTNDWSYTFQPQEQINMTINFDGRHLRKDKGTLYFQSNLDAFYEGHPDAEHIPLKGEVHFPSVVLDKRLIDFGVVINGTEAMEEFSATNACNFCLAYKWYIKPFSTVIHSTKDQIDMDATSKSPNRTRVKTGGRNKSTEPQTPIGLKKTIANTSFEPRSNIRETMSLDKVIHKNENDSAESSEFQKQKKVYEMSNSTQSLDNYGESVQYLRRQIYRSRMMEMVGLHDPDNQIEDELLYLQQNREEPKMVESVALSELIDIVPMAGVIQAGQTQKFTIVFYGHPDIHFKTTVLCYLEGGTSQYLNITGRSIGPAPKLTNTNDLSGHVRLSGMPIGGRQDKGKLALTKRKLGSQALNTVQAKVRVEFSRSQAHIRNAHRPTWTSFSTTMLHPELRQRSTLPFRAKQAEITTPQRYHQRIEEKGGRPKSVHKNWSSYGSAAAQCHPPFRVIFFQNAYICSQAH